MKYGFKLINHALRGESHIKNDTPCQDKVHFINQNNTQVIALADGAGSCKYSDIGAAITTKICAEYLTENFDAIFEEFDNEILGKKLINGIIKTIKTEYDSETFNEDTDNDSSIEAESSEKIDDKKHRFAIEDYSSTLLFLAFSNGKYLSGHIGDGMICINDDDIKVLSEPENGETPNSTHFFTTKNAEKYLRMKKGTITNDTTFVLMSDGTYECVYDRKENKFANALYKFVEWTIDGEQEEVSVAIKSNMEKHFPGKTTDDFSISILHVSIIRSIIDKISEFFNKTKYELGK